MAEIPDSIYLHPASDLDIFTREPGKGRVEYRRVRKCVWTSDTSIAGHRYKDCANTLWRSDHAHAFTYCPICGGEIEIKESE